MEKVIDARGLGCPQPVILAKKALEQQDEITMIVDNEVAAENIKRMGTTKGCILTEEKKEDGTFCIHLSKKSEVGSIPQQIDHGYATGPFVVAISSDCMGQGNDELGGVLIRSFIHTLVQLNPLPETIICYNAGIKLAVKDSAVLDDLRQLAQAGVDIIVCGTCVNYFNFNDQIAVGRISNMYEIVDTMAGAARLVRP